MEAVHESEVLKKLDASIRNDENQWPQFPLRDVSIFSQKTGRPISLLQAHKTGKVQVTGNLHDQDADADARSRFKKRFQKQQRVYIKDVDMYSYGKYEDDSLAFWAAGESGWFELRTQASDYRSVYAKMEEATEILYFMISRAGRQRKDWKKATTKQIEDIMRVTFTAFRDSPLNKQRQDYHDCVEAFTEHRHFLIKCMLEGAESLEWNNTPFLRWFEKHVPNDFALIRDIVNQTGTASFEDLDNEPVPPAPRPKARARVSIEEQEHEMVNRGAPKTNDTMDIDKPVGRRSKRLAALEDEGNSSEELTNRRGQARGKHKRKSMLRIPGSAKTPKKTHIRRVDGPSSVREPPMEYFREMKELDKTNAPYPKPAIPEETELPSHLVRDLKYTDLDDEEEKVSPAPDYMEIKGPGGTWTCPLDGCCHQVWDAESATGKMLIKTHYAHTHQDGIEELIRSETRPWAKTNYLLEKVRNMKQAQAQGIDEDEDEDEDGKERGPVGFKGKNKENQAAIFPKPIKRKI